MVLYFRTLPCPVLCPLTVVMVGVRCMSLLSDYRCAGHQGENHAALGSQWQDRPQAPTPGQCQHRGTQGRTASPAALQRTEGWEARPACGGAGPWWHTNWTCGWASPTVVTKADGHDCDIGGVKRQINEANVACEVCGAGVCVCVNIVGQAAQPSEGDHNAMWWTFQSVLGRWRTSPAVLLQRRKFFAAKLSAFEIVKQQYWTFWQLA